MRHVELTTAASLATSVLTFAPTIEGAEQTQAVEIQPTPDEHVKDSTPDSFSIIPYAIVAAIISLPLFLHRFRRREPITPYPRICRDALVVGLTKLSAQGEPGVRKWFDTDEISKLLVGNVYTSKVRDPMRTLLRSLAGVLTYDPLAATHIGYKAPSSFLGIYWELMADREKTNAMRRTEKELMENDRDPYEIYAIAGEHIYIAEHMSGIEGLDETFDDSADVETRIAHVEKMLVRSLHWHAAAQIYYQAAASGDPSMERIEGLRSAEIFVGRALSPLRDSRKTRDAITSFHTEAIKTIFGQMEVLEEEIKWARVEREKGAPPKGASGFRPVASLPGNVQSTGIVRSSGVMNFSNPLFAPRPISFR